ncbi:MAG: pyridoxamine 5'-phosphate oxidase [Bacteroidales bacterium]|nr:pyridoxamine 5'-phosphate oxidase [Bacteroidales bacterium]
MENIEISNLYVDPFDLFKEWYGVREKSGLENYNAVALSTAGSNGRVSSRMVLLKKFDTVGFVFFTNYSSKKGLHLAQNPYASMLFYWPEQGRQVRIEGSVKKVSKEESDTYFNSRNHGHKLNALASDQSREIPDKEYLVQRYNELAEKYGDKAPRRPLNWGGYRLIPHLFEFWQEGKNRLHDRIEYCLQGGVWLKRRLAP